MAHTSPCWACNKRQTKCSVLYVCWRFLHIFTLGLISKDQYVARTTLGRHIKLFLDLYVARWDKIHLFELNIRWNKLWRKMNRKDRFFSRFLYSSWVNNAHLLSISFNKHTQPDFYPYNHNYMHGNCGSNSWFMGSKKVCDSSCQFAPVITSLRQFVKVCDNRGVTNCLWLSHCQPW